MFTNVVVENLPARLSVPPAFDPVSKVVILVDSEHVYEAGDDSGHVLEITCPYGTQALADSLLQVHKGFVYQPLDAGDTLVDPAVELGDGITVSGVYTMLAEQELTFDAHAASRVKAPGQKEIEIEYQFQTKEQQLDRKIANTRAELKRSSTEIRAAVESTNGDVAALDIKVDSIKMEVYQTTGADGQVYSSIELTVGDNTYTGQILMEGNLDVSGQLSADALYAAKGDIADLAVDKLSTSRRIVKYLAGDTSDDNFIRAEDEILAFVSGVYAGGTEQATTPEGTALYWERDISGASLGADGYPYKDGTRVFTTTGVTNWPVMVYTYTELVKAQMAFEPYESTYVPILTMGAGDGAGGDYMTVAKRKQKGEILYKAKGGKEIGMTMGYDGYTDILGQRRTQTIDINKTEGKITVLAEGESSAEEITYTETDNSMTFVWSDGHTATVTIS